MKFVYIFTQDTAFTHMIEGTHTFEAEKISEDVLMDCEKDFGSELDSTLHSIDETSGRTDFS